MPPVHRARQENVSKRKHEQVPIDPELRAKALQIIGSYQNKSTTPASDSPADILSAAVPAAMKVIGENIESYDRGELSVTAQKQLISMMKKIVNKYGDLG